MVKNNGKLKGKSKQPLDKMSSSKVNELGESERIAFQLKNFDKFVNQIEILTSDCNKRGYKFDYYIMPLNLLSKTPSVKYSWTKHKLTTQLTLKESRERISEKLGNIGLVATNNFEDPQLSENTVCLTFIDIDLEEDGKPKLPLNKIKELIKHMDTFTVVTRSGGLHLYVATPLELSEIFKRKYGVKNPHPRYNGIDFGEIRMSNQYIVGCGSYVPPDSSDEKKVNNPHADGYYKVLINKPIRIITEDSFPKWMTFRKTGGNVDYGGEYIDVDINRDRINSISTFDDTKILNRDGKSLYELCKEDLKLNRLLSSADEVVVSTETKKKADRSKTDFITAHLLKKYNFDSDTTWMILRNFRQYAKTARDDYLDMTISKVFGYVEETYESPFQNKDKKSQNSKSKKKSDVDYEDESEKGYDTIGDRYDIEEKTNEVILTEFPEMIDKSVLCIHLRGLPRTGKSFNGIRYMGQYDSGVYVCPNHDIIDQQFATFKKLYPEKSCVRLMGKGNNTKLCKNEADLFQCTNCPYKPRFNKDVVITKRIEEGELKESDREIIEKDVISIKEMEKLSKEWVIKYKHIDMNTFYTDDFKNDYENDNKRYCPYYALHFCEENVDYVFTIPYYTVSDDPITKIREREVCVIDEDTSFKFYQPTDLLIMETADYRNGISIIANHLIEYIGLLEQFETYVTKVKIKNEDNEVQLVDKKRLMRVDRVILGIIATIRQMNDMIETYREDHIPENVNDLIDDLKTVKFKLFGDEADKKYDINYYDIVDDDKKMVLDKVTEFEKTVKSGKGENSLASLFEPFLYPYINNKIVELGKYQKSLYLVGDKSKLIRKPNCGEKYILIGFTEAGLFAEQMFPNTSDRLRLRVSWFPYGKNFKIFSICGENKQKQTSQFRNIMRRMVVANKNEDWTVPYMVLTSSQKKQEEIWKRYSSDATHMCREDNIYNIFDTWYMGKGLIFYQNSVISRGIDIPFMDIIFVDSCNFAQPYYEAVVNYYEQYILDLKVEYTVLLKKIKKIIATPNSPDIEKLGEYEDILNKLSNDIKESSARLADENDIRNLLLVDETTNSVLRPTPVNKKREDQCKFVIIKEDNLPYISSEALQNMTIKDVTNKVEMNELIEVIRDFATKFNKMTTRFKLFGTKLLNITSIFDEYDIESESKKDFIKYGKSYVEFEERADKIEELKSNTGSIKSINEVSPIVYEIAKLLVTHVTFKTASKTERGKSGNTSSTTLFKWVKQQSSKISVKFTEKDIENAIMYIIDNLWVTPSKVVERHTLNDNFEYDSVSINYKLTMYQKNREKIKNDTNGEIDIQLTI